jgi:sulfate adenylyltransferase subunit 1 (EFTu-like GTPase family)
VLAINKMDLVDFDREVYEKILDDFSEFLTWCVGARHPDERARGRQRHHAQRAHAVLRRSSTARVPRDRAGTSQPAGGAVPFPGADGASSGPRVPRIRGPDCVGSVRTGDRITAWPSGRSARIKRIVTYDGDLAMAFAPMSVTLTLDDEIDISRGDVLTVEPAFVGQRFEAELVWMDERPLDPGRVYLLKHGTRTVTAEVNHALVLNQIGNVQISTARPIVFDRYAENRGTGSFILIDPATQFTCGAGMIT